MKVNDDTAYLTQEEIAALKAGYLIETPFCNISGEDEIVGGWNTYEDCVIKPPKKDPPKGAAPPRQRPPRGVMPRKLWLESRADDLYRAITDQIEAMPEGHEPTAKTWDWIQEYLLIRDDLERIRNSE